MRKWSNQLQMNTSLLMWVGCMLIEIIMCIQLGNAPCTTPYFPSNTRFGWITIVQLNGTYKNLPAGSPNAVCCSLPTNFLNHLQDMDSSRVTWHISVTTTFSLLDGSSIHRHVPSNAHPRVSLWMSHIPLYTIIFLTDIKPPISQHVMDGGGKIRCISLMTNWDMWQNSSTDVGQTRVQTSSTQSSRKSCRLQRSMLQTSHAFFLMVELVAM